MSPPRPIEVKKLIEKRVFFGLSRGKIPSKYSVNVLSMRKEIASMKTLFFHYIRIGQAVVEFSQTEKLHEFQEHILNVDTRR